MYETIFYNGNIISLEREGETFEAVYVSEGRIKSCGSFLKVKAEAGEKVIMKDLQGKTMLPAFIDGHSHFATVGSQALNCDLSECQNFNEITECLRRHIKEKKIPDGEIVVGSNYDHNFLMEQKQPDKAVLDRVSLKHPILISHTSGHMGTVNSYMLNMLGLDNSSVFGEGGKYSRYENSDELSGHMEENAFISVMKNLKQPKKEEMKRLILEGQREYLKNGITTVQNGGSNPEQTDILIEIAKEDKFDIDVVNYMIMGETDTVQMEKYRSFNGKYHNRLKIEGYKIFLDGSPQGKTAWLSKPYEGEKEYSGYPAMGDEKVYESVCRALREGRQLLAHCNGDAASEQFITAYEKAVRDVIEAGESLITDKLRPVMIHAQTVRKDQLKRMKEIGMIPSIFTAHVYYWGDIHLKNLGKERGNNISPARDAIDEGLVINFHQDTPVIKPNMLETVWCAVNRISAEGKTIGEKQKISVYEALRAVTYGGAYEYFEENEKGTIKEGKYADFVVLSENPFTIDKRKIKDIKVLKTYKEGKLIYEWSEV